MSENDRRTVTLTEELAEAVRAAVRSGDYASATEVVREALRDWQYKRGLRQQELDRLRADIDVGLDDLAAGRVRDFDAERIIAKGRKRSPRRATSA